jgi:hypothetical protein
MVSPTTLPSTSRRLIVRPLVVLAAKLLGPGRRRLQMVKLAHQLGEDGNYFDVFYPRRSDGSGPDEAPTAHRRRRAA